MVGEPLLTLTLLFSIIAGTAACILSLLTLEILRRTPFGRGVFVLSVVLGLFVLYHVFLLLLADVFIVEHTFKSVMYTGVAVVVWSMVWSQHRLRHSGDEVTP